jgi:hypothetical protein
MRTVILSLAAVLGLSSSTASAEDRFEAALLIGPTFATQDTPALEFGRGTTYQVTFGWHLWQLGRTRVSLEVPLIASPAFTTRTPGAALPKEYATAFLTPSARFAFLVDRPISFFGSVGGGYARYSESKLREDNGPNLQQLDTNSGALQLGGGVDLRGPGWVGFRGEVRDIWTGARRFSVSTPGRNVHNVTVSGGIVARF